MAFSKSISIVCEILEICQFVKNIPGEYYSSTPLTLSRSWCSKHAKKWYSGTIVNKLQEVDVFFWTKTWLLQLEILLRVFLDLLHFTVQSLYVLSVMAKQQPSWKLSQVHFISWNDSTLKRQKVQNQSHAKFHNDPNEVNGALPNSINMPITGPCFT